MEFLDDTEFYHRLGGFINVFSTRTFGVHRWAKPFELNFITRTSFCQMVKPGGKYHPHS